METNYLKKIVAVLLSVMFLVTITASSVSAGPANLNPQPEPPGNWLSTIFHTGPMLSIQYTSLATPVSVSWNS